MGVYRLEISSTNRAGCKNKECLDNGVKIPKGELRFGTQVEFQEHQSWHWRHWGCVTPKQLANLNDTIGGNFDYLDGFDEITPEMQEKVRLALEQGHVDDNDWKGDVEFNRPGTTGTRKRTPKKKRVDDASEANDSEQSPTKPATKKRARAKKITEDEIEEFVDEPAPKKAKAGGRKGKKAGAAEIEPIAEEKAPLAPKKAKRATKTAKVATGETKAEKDVEASSGATKDGRVAKQPKGRKKAAKTSVEKSEEEDVDVDEDGEEPPKKKRGRKKAVGGLQKGVSKMTTRPRGKKATADV